MQPQMLRLWREGCWNGVTVHCKEVLRVGTLITDLLPVSNQRFAGPTFICGKNSEG